jgi:hypothetical protein
VVAGGAGVVAGAAGAAGAPPAGGGGVAAVGSVVVPAPPAAGAAAAFCVAGPAEAAGPLGLQAGAPGSAAVLLVGLEALGPADVLADWGAVEPPAEAELLESLGPPEVLELAVVPGVDEDVLGLAGALPPAPLGPADVAPSALPAAGAVQSGSLVAVEEVGWLVAEPALFEPWGAPPVGEFADAVSFEVGVAGLAGLSLAGLAGVTGGLADDDALVTGGPSSAGVAGADGVTVLATTIGGGGTSGGD